MSEDRYEQLMDEARGLPSHSGLRVAVLEQAAREADRLGDEQRGYESRHQIVQVGTFSGNEDKALVAFSWCLAYADRQDDFPMHSLLWQYKWIVRSLTDYPTITRAQIRSMLDDFGRRLEKQGYDPRSLHKLEWSTALDLGDDEIAVGFFERWQDSPRGMLSDCIACDTNAIVRYHSYFDRDAEAIHTAEPILAGELSCACVPHNTYGMLLSCLVAVGRVDDADEYQKKGYRMISGNRDFLSNIADHLLHLVLRERWDRAVRMLERHLPWRLETHSPSDAFEFDLAAWMLCERLVDRGNRVRGLRTPANFPLHEEGDRYRPSDLAAWFEDRARETAARFDDRNGNDDYARRIPGTMEYVGVRRGDEGGLTM